MREATITPAFGSTASFYICVAGATLFIVEYSLLPSVWQSSCVVSTIKPVWPNVTEPALKLLAFIGVLHHFS